MIAWQGDRWLKAAITSTNERSLL